jgi:hypothetical protein
VAPGAATTFSFDGSNAMFAVTGDLNLSPVKNLNSLDIPLVLANFNGVSFDLTSAGDMYVQELGTMTLEEFFINCPAECAPSSLKISFSLNGGALSYDPEDPSIFIAGGPTGSGFVTDVSTTLPAQDVGFGTAGILRMEIVGDLFGGGLGNPISWNFFQDSENVYAKFTLIKADVPCACRWRTVRTRPAPPQVPQLVATRFPLDATTRFRKRVVVFLAAKPRCATIGLP